MPAALAVAGLLVGRVAAGPPSMPSPLSSASAAAEENPNLDLGTSLGGKPAPEVKLVNQFGQPMSLSQFRGRVVMLSFEDSECTTVCPLTTQSMVLAKELLGTAGKLGPAARRGRQPGRDQGVRRAGLLPRARHGEPVGLPHRVASPSSRRYGRPTTSRSRSSGQIDHTPALYVIDQQGRLQKVYLTQMAYSSITQSAQVLAAEVSSLLPSHPKLSSLESLAAVPGQTPAAAVTLPAAAGGRRDRPAAGTVTLGPGKARLVVFFATWLTETSNLSAELTGLNSYVKDAASKHLPALTAVDETVTEPSDAAVTRLPAPARAARLPGRPRRDGPGRGRLRRAGPALARPGERGRQDHLAARRLGTAASPGTGRGQHTA